MKKKSLSLLIAVAMATTMVPSTMAFADTTAPVEDTQEPTEVTKAPASTYAVTYDTHIQSRGWNKSVKVVTGDQEDITAFKDAGTSGTIGRSLRVEALKVSGVNLPEGASIEYRVHQQSFGWSKTASNGEEAGVTGKGKRAEAVQITLKGMPGYAIKYQVHVQSKGWMDAVTTENGTEVKDAKVAGTTGESKRIEAIRIQIVKTDEEKAAEVAAINAVNKAEATKKASDITIAKQLVEKVRDTTVYTEQNSKVEALLKDEDVTEVNTVKEVKAINNTTFEVPVELESVIDSSALEGTKLTLTNGDVTVDATFSSVDGKSAVYTIADKEKLTPGDGSADGAYTVAATGLKIPEGTTTTYSEALTGNMIRGYVMSDSGLPVEGATVEVNGRTVKTDAYGFYSISSNAGKRTVTVKAPGYFSDEAKDVVVKKNTSTAENFEITRRNDKKLYIDGTAIDETTSSPIEKATVDLYEEGNANPIATVETGKDGKFSFGNTVAVSTDHTATTGFTDMFGEPTDKLDISKSYKVVIKKDLSEDNLDDVYKEISKDFKLEQSKAETKLETLSLTPVKAIDKVAFNLDWSDEITTSSTETLNVDFIAPDGSSVLKGNSSVSVDVEKNKMKNAYDLVAKDFFGSSVKPTLPSGTYYLRVKDGTNAITIIPIKITEGESIEVASKTIQKAASKNVTLSVAAKESKALANQNGGGNLRVVTDNSGALGSDDVESEFNITQNIDGVDVVIDTKSNVKFDYTAASSPNPAKIEGNIQVTNIVEGVKYKVVPTGAYTVGEAQEISANTNAADTNATMNFSSAAKVVGVDLSNANNELPTTSTASGKILVNNVQLLDKDGKVVKETGMFKFDIPSALSGYNSLLSDREFTGVPVGEYKIKVDIEGYKPVESELTKVIDFEDATFDIAKKIEKISSTTVKGYIHKDAEPVNGVQTDGDADATVMLYDKDGKLVAAEDYCYDKNKQATYSLESGTDGTIKAGTYTLVVRGAGFETYTKEITVEDNKDTICNVDVTDGGEAYAKISIRDNNNAAIASGESVRLLDKNYVPLVSGYADDLLLGKTFAFDGEYELDQDSTNTNEWVTNTTGAEQLSKGDYKLVIGTMASQFNIFTKAVKVNDVNDELNTSATVTNKVSGKTVNLTVNINNVAAKKACYVRIVDENGNAVAMDKATTNPASSNTATSNIKVGANGTYTVEAYNDGKFVGKTEVTVQDFATSISLSLDDARN